MTTLAQRVLISSRHRWRTLAPLPRQFIVNLLIALVVLVTLQLFQHQPLLARQQSAGLDWLMRMTANTPAPADATPYLFIDLDTPSWVALGEPHLVPAEVLARLLEQLVETRANEVILDIDLSRRSLRDLAPLAAVMARWQASGDAPPLTLMRTLTPAPTPAGLGTPRATVLEDVSAGAAWAAPFFTLDPDRRVRRWRLVEPVCQGGQAQLLPSVQLVALARQQDALASLQAQLDRWPGGDCEGETLPALPRLQLGEQSVQLYLPGQSGTRGLGERILFTLPDAPASGWAHQPLASGGSRPLVIRLPVSALLAQTERLPDHLVYKRTVIIGASHVESGDVHATPLGSMAGPMVLINALHSLERFGQIRPPSFWTTALITSLLVLVLSFCFVRLPPLWANLGTLAGIVLLVIPLSLLYFRSGVWLNFLLPLLAVEVYRWIHRFRQYRRP
ncbi:CHASE2 domain-containing protein [Isoalcanivorax indicus]|uniref:CHASE2 domain-containing protein n=1 Tax=Isoalcanivorax indicus TaxID=2202653 RepID=UPI000DBA9B1A|nr:CHASE2 domain-containing protein [Isoalcanivorax indicus]